MQGAKYHAIRDRIRDMVEGLEVGSALPAERAWAQELEVSRMTLRRAIDELVREGLVERRHGAGTFVASPKITQPLTITSFSEDMRRRGMTPSSLTLRTDEIHAGPQLGRRLAVSPSTRLLRIVRHRFVDEAPMALETLHVVAARFPWLRADDLATGSFYELLAQRGVELARAVQTIEPTVTDEEESELLGVPLHSPAFLFERTSWDAEDRPLEFVRSVYRGDRYKLTAELRRGGPTEGHDPGQFEPWPAGPGWSPSPAPRGRWPRPTGSRPRSGSRASNVPPADPRARAAVGRPDRGSHGRPGAMTQQIGTGDHRFAALDTEGRLPEARDLDLLPTRAQVALMASQDRRAVEAVAAAGDAIAAAVDLAVPRLRRGGRLIEVGAGTPGRIAMLDVAECGPTFGLEDGRVLAVLAGGERAARETMEHGEDDAGAGREDLDAVGVGPDDVVVGVSASGRTPYVLAALEHATAAGAATVAVVSNPDSPIAGAADVAVEVLTGPEVVSGSTRLKAGSAQKLVLNALSTLTMVQLGRTFGDLMVDVRATNDKLRWRAHRIVAQATGADAATVQAALAAADGHAKVAVVAILAGVPAAEAARRLEAAGGRVRDALAAGVGNAQ